MRERFSNPFVSRECEAQNIPQAPIATVLSETYGQCNEDLIVEGLLRALTSEASREMASVRYLEIGANHPIQTNATYLLYRRWGASGILVEANPHLVPPLRAVRPRDTVVHAAITGSYEPSVTIHIHQSNELTSLSPEHIARFTDYGGTDGIIENIEVQNLHIQEFLAMYVTEQVDFMSVDIEGFDAEVLGAMGDAFRPALVQCEHEDRVSQFSMLMAGMGYRLVAVSDVNAIFLHAEG